jgi:serine/threonine protein kinase
MSKDVPEAHEPTQLSESGAARLSSMPTAGSLDPGTIVGERYRVLELLGAGAQGEVWRAEDIEIEGHIVALKILAHRAVAPADREYALRELRMLAAVSHPSVVQFKGHGWLGGRLWFAMPWYDGKDLESQMPLTRAEARRVFETLAAGLAAVHAKGLRHQDIKPSNILLAKVAGLEDTLPVLLDFGVAAKEGEELVAGSPDYFAPELAAGWPSAAKLGPEADVFSLALTLRNVLEPSTAPTVGAFDRASLDRRAKEPVPAPSAPELAFLRPHFERWLAIDPSKRPTAVQLVGELAVLTAPEDRRAERRALARRMAPWAVLVLVLGAAGGWFAWQSVVDARKASAAASAAQEEAAAQAARASATAEDAVQRAAASSQRTEDALRRLDDAETEIGRAEGDAARLRAARDALRSALADARSELTTTEATLRETQARLIDLNTQLDDTRRALATALHDLDATRSQLSTTQHELDAARSQLTTTTSERDTARTQLAAAESSLSTAQSALDSERSAHSTEHEQDALERAQLTARVAELSARVNELEARLAASSHTTVEAPTPTPPPVVGPGEPPPVVVP